MYGMLGSVKYQQSLPTINTTMGNKPQLIIERKQVWGA